MGKILDKIDPEHVAWIKKQHMFFVASAPLSLDGHVNCSPRGGDSLRVVGPREIIYRDLIGSGAETAAHARENGRILIMFCAFEGPPRILRCHGRSKIVLSGQSRFDEFEALFDAPNKGTRAYVHIDVTRISTSCGFGVPFYDYVGERPILRDYYEQRTPEKLRDYMAEKNRLSIDGLPAFES